MKNFGWTCTLLEILFISRSCNNSPSCYPPQIQPRSSKSIRSSFRSFSCNSPNKYPISRSPPLPITTSHQEKETFVKRLHLNLVFCNFIFIMAVFRSQENIAELSAVATDRACAVCIQPFQSSQECLITSCKHMYHADCIKSWVLTSSECPCCKRACYLRDLQPISIPIATNDNNANPSSNNSQYNLNSPRGTNRYYTRSQRRRIEETVANNNSPSGGELNLYPLIGTEKLRPPKLQK